MSNTVAVRCQQCGYLTNRLPQADFGACPKCNAAALARTVPRAEYLARIHSSAKGRTAIKVKCYACGFISERLERRDGTFGACSDCGEPMTRFRSWNQYVYSGAAREVAAEAFAARLLNELHQPILRVRRNRRRMQTVYAKYGRAYFSKIARFPRKKGRRYVAKSANE